MIRWRHAGLRTISWFFLSAQVFGVLWIGIDRFGTFGNPEKHAKVRNTSLCLIDANNFFFDVCFPEENDIKDPVGIRRGTLFFAEP